MVTDGENNGDSDDSSYESAVKALLSPGIHQATTKEEMLRSARRRTKTISDMRWYWSKILRKTEANNNRAKDAPKPLLIHITGTKGKGSTACMCESVLRHHGYATGLFTSPHLIDIRERIRWNGNPIHPSIFGSVYWKIRNALESDDNGSSENNNDDPPPKLPGYFRMLTLMGMYTFLHELSGKIDVVILEVGMGGRYDATNFLNSTTANFRSVANGVTLLDLDHTRVLGDTLEKIAWEKGGIFSVNKLNPDRESEHPKHKDEENAVVKKARETYHLVKNDPVAYKTYKESLDKLHNDMKTLVAKNTTAKPTMDPKETFLIPRNYLLDSNKPGVVDVLCNCAMVEGMGGSICLIDATQLKLNKDLQANGLSLGLAGSHQIGNATLAIALCKSVIAGDTAPTKKRKSIDNEIDTRSPITLGALASAKWPGRCQTLEWSGFDGLQHHKPMQFFLDGAHTPQSLAATVEWLRSKQNTSNESSNSKSSKIKIGSNITKTKNTPLPILVFNCSHERNPVELLELFLQNDRDKDPFQFSRVYFAKSDSTRPSPVAKASAESLLKDKGIPIRNELLIGDSTRTWQETLGSIWNHLNEQKHELSSSVVCNMTASQVLEDLPKTQSSKDGATAQVFVTGSLYLVGSFLTALGWSEPSSQPI